MEIFLKILKITGLVLAGAAGYVVLSVIIGFLSGLFTGHKKEYKKDSKFYRFVLYSMTGLVLFLGRIKVVKKGVDLPEGRFLIVGNHRSNFDPIVTWYKFRKKNIAYISKPQNLKVPFYGAIVRRCCFLPIDRQSARNAVTTIEKAAELLKNDAVSIGVYPEGTRYRVSCICIPVWLGWRVQNRAEGGGPDRGRFRVGNRKGNQKLPLEADRGDARRCRGDTAGGAYDDDDKRDRGARERAS